jgi:hypothetical protein
MMLAIGKSWHRVAAAELCCDLVHVAEGPAALAVIELDQRAAPYSSGGTVASIRGGDFRGLIDVTVALA